MEYTNKAKALSQAEVKKVRINDPVFVDLVWELTKDEEAYDACHREMVRFITEKVGITEDDFYSPERFMRNVWSRYALLFTVFAVVGTKKPQSWYTKQVNRGRDCYYNLINKPLELSSIEDERWMDFYTPLRNELLSILERHGYRANANKGVEQTQKALYKYIETTYSKRNPKIAVEFNIYPTIASFPYLPSIKIYAPSGKYAGMALTIRAALGGGEGEKSQEEKSLQQKQREGLFIMRRNGWLAEFGYGFDHAKSLVDDYMKNIKTEQI